jgi:rod shape-determining protein MreC
MDNSNYLSTKIRGSISVLFSPIYYLVSMPENFIVSTNDYISSQEKLIKENTILRTKNLELQGLLQKFDVVNQENQRLRELLQSSEKVSDKLLVAELLYVPSDPGVQQFVLNQGSNKGVFIGQAVIDANGVVGQVVEVNPFNSRVLLITDIDHAIPIEVLRNNIRAIAIGMGEKKQLSLMNISNTADIIVGDILVSSSLGDRFPSGYPVGKVVAVDKNPALPFAKIIVEPLAKLGQMKEALLVWPGSKVTYSEPLPEFTPGADKLKNLLTNIKEDLKNNLDNLPPTAITAVDNTDTISSAEKLNSRSKNINNGE